MKTVELDLTKETKENPILEHEILRDYQIYS